MTEHYPFTGSWSRILLLTTQSEKAEPSRKPETSPVKSSKRELLRQAARQEPERRLLTADRQRTEREARDDDAKVR